MDNFYNYWKILTPPPIIFFDPSLSVYLQGNLSLNVIRKSVSPELYIYLYEDVLKVQGHL